MAIPGLAARLITASFPEPCELRGAQVCSEYGRVDFLAGVEI